MARSTLLSQRRLLAGIASLGMLVNFDEDRTYVIRLGKETFGSPLAFLVECNVVKEFVLGSGPSARSIFELAWPVRDWAREYDIASRSNSALPAPPAAILERLAKPISLKTRSTHTQTTVRGGASIFRVESPG